ncbi:unnamed protein product, partial [Phaeothamnion confervicola]
PDADVPGFSEAFKDAGRLVVDVGLLVAAQCDRYVERRCPGYEANKLGRIIAASRCCKARLLHYFPKGATAAVAAVEGADGADEGADETPLGAEAPVNAEAEAALEESQFSDWCAGWHADHGSLTGLIPAVFLNEDGREVENPDPACGLYIRSRQVRQGALVKAALPADVSAGECLFFQIGEAAQIHTGGLLAATPHAVRGPRVPRVSRESFAVFMEPMWDEEAVARDSDADAAGGSTAAEAGCAAAKGRQNAVLLPAGMTPLADRWSPGISFGEFTRRTLQSYY